MSVSLSPVEKNGITVTVADADQLERWNGFVERSPQGTVFHRLEVLRVVADHSDTTLYPLVGMKGQEQVGVFPVFERDRNIATLVFSPPPNLGLSQLGPAMADMSHFKSRRAEKRTHRFVEASLGWVQTNLTPSYVHMRLHRRFPDGRPFVWADFSLTPRYTYVLDIDRSADDIMADFSSDARKNVRSTPAADFTIEDEGQKAIPRIIGHLERRHEEQGLDYVVSSAFVTDLHRVLPEECIHPYVCRVDGQYVSGMITLEDDETVYRWQGGARPMTDVDVPINDLLDWRLITDGRKRGRRRYDLVGANTPHLCEYKSKFAPKLATYYSAEAGTSAMRFASKVYQRVQQFK